MKSLFKKFIKWKLSPRNSEQSTDISIRVLKKNIDIFCDYICRLFNDFINDPAFKKGYSRPKGNYCPVSILPVIFTKSFEKLLCKQITIFIDTLLSKYICGFRKGFVFNIHAVLEKWENAADKGKMFGELLTDLSKAFDWFSTWIDNRKTKCL